MSQFCVVSIVAALVLWLPACAADRELIGTASVVDGDTLEIRGQRIRLYGVDAPESRQQCQRSDGSAWRCGNRAANALSQWLGSATVHCTLQEQDRYGRWLASCSRGGQDIGGWLVRSGWALAYRRYSEDYVDDEKAAKKAKAGIHEGHFQPPWDYRRSSR